MINWTMSLIGFLMILGLVFEDIYALTKAKSNPGPCLASEDGVTSGACADGYEILYSLFRNNKNVFKDNSEAQKLLDNMLRQLIVSYKVILAMPELISQEEAESITEEVNEHSLSLHNQLTIEESMLEVRKIKLCLTIENCIDQRKFIQALWQDPSTSYIFNERFGQLLIGILRVLDLNIIDLRKSFSFTPRYSSLSEIVLDECGGMPVPYNINRRIMARMGYKSEKVVPTPVVAGSCPKTIQNLELFCLKYFGGLPTYEMIIDYIKLRPQYFNRSPYIGINAPTRGRQSFYDLVSATRSQSKQHFKIYNVNYKTTRFEKLTYSIWGLGSGYGSPGIIMKCVSE